MSVQVPEFNADSAYAYIQKQVDFGPRVPNSEGHAQCADWLYQKLDEFSDQNFLQTAPETTWDGTKITMQNIVASFNPDAKKRVLLCAHWDTRPWADEDIVDQDKPILGANDGGSGVGVLIEIARQLSQNPIDLGVDIVLFDAEDYGCLLYTSDAADE